MNKKEQFVDLLVKGALAYGYRTNDGIILLRIAASIPERAIADDPTDAANDFLAYCNGEVAQPKKWMLEVE
jgi:hypothetical protein